MAHDTLVNGVLGELELTACNFIANVIDHYHGMTLYLKCLSPTQYSGVSCTVRRRTPGVSCCRKQPRSGGCRESADARRSAGSDRGVARASSVLLFWERLLASEPKTAGPQVGG